MTSSAFDLSKYVDLLKKHSVFGLLFKKDSQYTLLLRKFPPMRIPAGTTISGPGEISPELVILLDGEVTFYKIESNQTLPTEQKLASGRAIELGALLKRKPNNLLAKTQKISVILRVPYEHLASLLETHPDLKTYLERQATHHEVRALSRGLRESGFSMAFVVSLVASLKVVKAKSNSLATSESGYFFCTSPHFSVIDERVDPWTQFTWLHYEFRSHESRHLKIRAFKSGILYKIDKPSFKKLSKLHPQESKLFASAEHPTDILPDIEVDEIEDYFKEHVEFNTKSGAPKWVQQNDEMDCSAACVAMVTQHYNQVVPIQFIRTLLNIDQQGASFYDLQLTFKALGFEAHTVEISQLADLNSNLLPVIALKGNHFVVIFSVDDHQVLIGDPAAGIYSLDTDTFESQFAGFVLATKPDLASQVSIPKVRNYQLYLQLVSKFKRPIALIGFFTLATSILSISMAFLSERLFDFALGTDKSNSQEFAILVGAGVLLVGASSAFVWLKTRAINSLSRSLENNLSNIFFSKLFKLNTKFFQTRRVGDFLQRVNEMEFLRRFISSEISQMALNVLSIVIFLTALIIYNYWVGLFILIVTPVAFLTVLKPSLSLYQKYAKVFFLEGKRESVLTEFIKGIVTLKTAANATFAVDKLMNLNRELSNERWLYNKQSLGVGTRVEIQSSLTHFITLIMCAYFASIQKLSFGQIVAIMALAERVIYPVAALADGWTLILETKNLLDRLNDVLLAPSESSGHTQKLKVPLQGAIEFQNVWFRYGGESSDWILQNLSFKIEAGERVELKGPSGCGKSTVIALILGLYKPSKGKVLLDGRNIEEFDLEWLRSRIGFADHEPHLFDGTLAENITMNNPFDQKVLDQCAELAQLHQVIENKTKGFETPILQNSTMLSTGERQRLNIARVFYRRPDFFVFDEFTSCLDKQTETQVLKKVRTEIKNKTVIHISHQENPHPLTTRTICLNRPLDSVESLAS